MGREIRRVPADWKHPTTKCAHSPWKGGCDQALANNGQCFQPLYDETFATAMTEWCESWQRWERGEDPDRKDHDMPYWEWAGDPPNPLYYRPSWPAESATHYQIYETVSEGTPVSPVFESLTALVEWLVAAGYSRLAAEKFAEGGYAPSMVMTQDKFYRDIQSLDTT